MTRFCFAIVACAVIGSPVSAQTIFSAKSAVVNSGGTNSTVIADSYNQNGLATKYISGVTDFNTYISGDPLHTALYGGNEWFGGGGTTGRVTYDLGSIVAIDRLALWNEESGGIGLLNLLGSKDGLTYTSIGSFSPIDNPVPSNPSTATYGAEVFSFTALSTRYVRFDMSSCGQPNGTYSGCSIGEVAFRNAPAVPEPATWAMMMIGFAVTGFSLRRKTVLRFV